MVIFIRMYTMVTMFAVILAYYNAKLYYDTASRKKFSTYIKLAIFTCLGALTHHFFLPYAFMLTAIMCICWMVKKEWHVLAKYAGFMILGVALSIAIFPATLDHMLRHLNSVMKGNILHPLLKLLLIIMTHQIL